MLRGYPTFFARDLSQARKSKTLNLNPKLTSDRVSGDLFFGASTTPDVEPMAHSNRSRSSFALRAAAAGTGAMWRWGYLGLADGSAVVRPGYSALVAALELDRLEMLSAQHHFLHLH